MSSGYYNDDAVVIPGRGAVLIAEAGTEAPTSDELQQWVKEGAVGALGSFFPIGHTSLDELPEIETDVEGGEVKGSWENRALRTTPIKLEESITVQPIQWTETPLKHRFGPGTIEVEKGHFVVPEVYSAQKVSILVVIMDGDRGFGIHYWLAETAPGGSISFSEDEFAALPVKYTILTYTGHGRQTLVLPHLKTSASEGEETVPSS